MKKILFMVLLLSATTVRAGELPLSLRNVNDDMSGIITDEQPDILLNPAEISKLDRWKFHMGIDNLLNRSELLKQLNDESKSKSITTSSPILSILGKQDSEEFKRVWIGTIYSQHNSQQYGLGSNDDLNPNLPDVQQPGISWEATSSTEMPNGLEITNTTETFHYMNSENLNIGMVYGWELNDKTNLGLSFKYSGFSSQEPNNYYFEHLVTTGIYNYDVYSSDKYLDNELNKDHNKYSLNLGLTEKLSKKSEIGISIGLSYVSDIMESNGYDYSQQVFYDSTTTRNPYLKEGWSSGLNDDNDNNIDEDGISGSEGNLPGVDDDGDGRIDEDLPNTDYHTSGVGIPLFLNYKASISDKLKLKAFVDTQVSISSLWSNTSNYYYLNDTYSNSVSTTNDCIEMLSSTQTVTTGTKFREYLQLGFGCETNITKWLTFFNGLKIKVNSYQTISSWDKTEYFTMKRSTSSDILSAATPTSSSKEFENGTINIDSTEWVLQVPVGIEIRPINEFRLQLGMTWQAKHLLVRSYGPDNAELDINNNRRTYNTVYYLGMSLRLNENMELNIFNSFCDLTRDSMLRWRASLKGYF